MQEQFVPYELAAKLKELGFDEPCLAYSYAEMASGDLYYGGSSSYIPTELAYMYVKIPLWQQATDWIRNKYGYYIFEDHRCNGKDVENNRTYWFGIKRFKEAPFGKEVTVGLIELGCHETYEKARQACLEKLIELIS